MQVSLKRQPYYRAVIGGPSPWANAVEWRRTSPWYPTREAALDWLATARTKVSRQARIFGTHAYILTATLKPGRLIMEGYIRGKDE